MCGIAGVVMRGGAEAPAGRLAAMRAALAHRGPDGHGDHRAGPVAFGHERLSIIDLAGSDQPLRDGAGRALVVNGEIYNYPDLRDAFPGHPWRTAGDCEPLLALYARDGLDFLAGVRGMFALALHDPAAGRVVLARDPFGIKPLYYAEGEDGLAFASEAGAVAAGLGAGARAFRPAAAAELLQLQFTTGADTVFPGVRRVLPGEVLVVEDGRVAERRRQPSPLPERVRRTAEPEALAGVDRAVMEAVHVHERSDVPYGLFLSSGIDSAAVLTAMARLDAEPVRSYTAFFPETGAHDEREAAAALARAAGARHTELPVTAADFFARLPAIAACLDDPVADYAIVPNFLLAERAARDVKVVLCGVGGDEIFAGYSRYRRQALPWWLGGRARRRKGPCDGLDLFRAPQGGWRDGIARAEAEARARNFSPLQRAQALDFADWLPHSVLTLVDRCLMAWGLEGRTPLLDRAVADFGFSLPRGLKMRGRRGKYALRLWLAEANPAARPFARKLGFTVPVGEWIAGDARRLGELVAREPGVDALCRPDAVRAVFASPDKAHRLLAWRLLFFALWHRRHVRGLPPEGGTLACLDA